ncbi:MAG: class I SAM-dependent methyltransferase [Prolixibacteraceae bacterium]
MEQLKTFFSGKQIHKVLDIGTGAGDFVKLIAPVFAPETKIIGIDPSGEALDEARQGNISPNVEFIQMEGEKLNFPDHSFDVICLSNAMHHLASTEQTFAEMKRVVKPNGWLLIAEIVSDGLNEAQENQKLWHHFKSYVDRKSGITHRETWTGTEVLEIIQSSKINPVLTFPFNRMAEPVTDPEKLQHWTNLFAGNLALLEGQPEYEEMAALFGKYKERVKLHGFQLARQLVVVGQPA